MFLLEKKGSDISVSVFISANNNSVYVEREGGSFLKRKVLDDKAFNANMLY